MPYLIQKKSDGTILRQWEFRNQVFTVGRGDKANAMIDDEQMSRLHFTIKPVDGGYTIEDCQSSNGTLVNGRLVKQVTPLRPGDEIRAGETRFRFEAALSTVIEQLERGAAGYTSFIKELSAKKLQEPGK